MYVLRRLLQICTSINVHHSSCRVPELEPLDALFQTTDAVFSKSYFQALEVVYNQPICHVNHMTENKLLSDRDHCQEHKNCDTVCREKSHNS